MTSGGNSTKRGTAITVPGANKIGEGGATIEEDPYGN